LNGYFEGYWIADGVGTGEYRIILSYGTATASFTVHVYVYSLAEAEQAVGYAESYVQWADGHIQQDYTYGRGSIEASNKISEAKSHLTSAKAYLHSEAKLAEQLAQDANRIQDDYTTEWLRAQQRMRILYIIIGIAIFSMALYIVRRRRGGKK
jgi:hypothetical protein